MHVTNKELEILQILWSANQSLNAKQISEYGSGMVMSTVQATLRNLLKKKLVEVDDIVYSGTVLSRTYQPTISQEEYIATQYEGLSISNLVNYLLKNSTYKESEQELEEIKQLIDKEMKE